MAVSDTRRAIAEAAAMEFIAKGYAAASISSIAERLGLTKGALSYHFRTKNEFADYFLAIMHHSTAQANAYATGQYPNSGSRRLLLYFMIMRHWRTKEIRHTAALTMFMDQSSPMFQKDEIIQSWLDLSEDALNNVVTKESELTPREAAELFLVTNMGATFFIRHLHASVSESKPLHFVRLALRAVGATEIDAQATEVFDRYRSILPNLNLSAFDNLRRAPR